MFINHLLAFKAFLGPFIDSDTLLTFFEFIFYGTCSFIVEFAVS